MSTTATLKPGNQLWGIYHTDREYARVMGDPLRTVIEAPTKLAAEEAAARLGFSEPWAHPVTSEVAQRAQWLPKRRSDHGNDSLTNPHAASASDHANTNNSPNPYRHRSAEKVRRTHQHQYCQ